jgi:hypothetical protein
MCIKFDSEPNELFILEATGNLGVHFKRFTNTVKHLGKFYTKLAHRQLEFERNDEHLQHLDGFIKEALGKKYACSFSGLRRQGTIVRKQK